MEEMILALYKTRHFQYDMNKQQSIFYSYHWKNGDGQRSYNFTDERSAWIAHEKDEFGWHPDPINEEPTP